MNKNFFFEQLIAQMDKNIFFKNLKEVEKDNCLNYKNIVSNEKKKEMKI